MSTTLTPTALTIERRQALNNYLRICEEFGVNDETLGREANVPSGPKTTQYDLFTRFFGERSELSNTIELWDAMPKYAVTARKQVHLRSDEGRLAVFEHSFKYHDKTWRVEIQPASIKTGNGDERIDILPSADEELVEEVIRKIFGDQQFGFHKLDPVESWTRFSLQMIRKELKARGKTRSIEEIKRSIEVLSKAHVTLYLADEPEPVYSSPILTDLVRVPRQKYLEDTSAMWAVRLPALISESVNRLSYRQFNYGALMSLSSQMARWLHKRLSHNYTNAHPTQEYSILFSTVYRDSGLLTQTRTSANIKTLDKAFDELVDAGVLLSINKEERRTGNKIDDVLYKLFATTEFTRDVKAANKRLSEAKAQLSIDKPTKQLQ